MMEADMLAMHARIVEENGTAETSPKSYAALRAVEWSRDRPRRGLSPKRCRWRTVKHEPFRCQRWSTRHG